MTDDYSKLLEVIEHDCGPGRRSGRWWSFHCPFPEHTRGDQNPSLAVTPDNGRWYCFTCGRSGDALGWLIQFRGMNYRHAKELTGNAGASIHPHRTAFDHHIWMSRGRALVCTAEENLWGPRGETVLGYLHRRGLKDTTIHHYHLGLLLHDQHESATTWGFTPDRGKVWLPKGITIPYLIGETLWSINIRRLDGSPKYMKIAGSKRALFAVENLLGADVGLFCEGEFDCMIADQQIGDAIGVATLGSASQKLDLVTWGPYLMRLKLILVAYDRDPAGSHGAESLTSLGRKIRKISLPAGPWKDINDFARAGNDLWTWIKAFIDLSLLDEGKNIMDYMNELGGVIGNEFTDIKGEI